MASCQCVVGSNACRHCKSLGLAHSEECPSPGNNMFFMVYDAYGGEVVNLCAGCLEGHMGSPLRHYQYLCPACNVWITYSAVGSTHKAGSCVFPKRWSEGGRQYIYPHRREGPESI